MIKPIKFKELVEMYLASPDYDYLAEKSKINTQYKVEILLKTGGKYDLYYSVDGNKAQDIGFMWFNQLKALNNFKSTNHWRNSLKTQLNTIYKWGIMHLGINPQSNPTIQMPELRHETREFVPYTGNDIQNIRKAMLVKGYHKLSSKQELMAHIALFLFETGMRPSEMMNLKVSDVVFDDDKKNEGARDRFIQIIGAKGREAGQVSRFLFVTKTIEPMLDYFAKHRSTRKNIWCENLIVGMRGKKLLPNVLSILHTDFRNKVGIKDKSLYDLRRGCATEIINNPEYGINVAMKQLGHKHIATTERYEILSKKRAALMFKGH